MADSGSRAAELSFPSSGQTEPLVLSRGHCFCVTNRSGDIAPAGARELGLFFEDTRYLSQLELRLTAGPLVVLSSATSGSAVSQIDLTLTDREFGGFLDDPQNFLHIRRKQLLDGQLIEQLVLTNHLRRAIELDLALLLGADFVDVFEVRGARRQRRGTLLLPEVRGDLLRFIYEGLDRNRYYTAIRMHPMPALLDANGPRYHVQLLPGESTVLEIVVEPGRGYTPHPVLVPFDVRSEQLEREHRQFVAGSTRVSSSNHTFDQALRHSLDDLDALRLRVQGRSILGAGIPWFAAPFGRDALIASLELLSVAPQLGAETLRTLAAFQGERFDPWREEEPGKILHELRSGEMARLNEIPHAPYYGSIDATPLWLILLGEVDAWCHDGALLDELLPNAERALAWLLRRLDEGEGLVWYQRQSAVGLVNQGWKDSRDGISFPDGTVAEAPVALIEVQGYAVAALEAMARLLAERSSERSLRLRERAHELRQKIQSAFWVEESGYYALALDGSGKQVRTITSNPGHLLFCRAVDGASAKRIAEVLLDEEMFTGWGVRTLGRGQGVFNPLSYHNGSVWPHDNALIALGAVRQGLPKLALAIFEGLYAASLHFRRYRLPELFCGFGRGESDVLVHYPVSCSPQAWSSGAFFLLLQACLGLQPDAAERTITIRDPQLPPFLDTLDLEGLRVGESRVTLHFARAGERTHADLLAVEGSSDIRVQIQIGG